jgi:thiol:disulfide interchange protein DsbA
MPQLKNYILLALACFSLAVTAQPRESIEGVHYQTLPAPVPTDTEEDVIEVRDVFWYGCPECSTLAPMMTEYRDGVRGDVKMVRMPAVSNDIMATHARIYYTAIKVDAEDRIHAAAFSAIHEHNNPLRTDAEIRELFLANGINAAAFESAWNAEDVIAAVQLARLRTSDYGIDKLPALIVGGRYRVTENDQVFNHIELNIAANLVIHRLREERRSDF